MKLNRSVAVYTYMNTYHQTYSYGLSETTPVFLRDTCTFDHEGDLEKQAFRIGQVTSVSVLLCVSITV